MIFLEHNIHIQTICHDCWHKEQLIIDCWCLIFEAMLEGIDLITIFQAKMKSFTHRYRLSHLEEYMCHLIDNCMAYDQ
jgi:hypothetical protein